MRLDANHPMAGFLDRMKIVSIHYGAISTKRDRPNSLLEPAMTAANDTMRL
jgi:hypothetical protein